MSAWFAAEVWSVWVAVSTMEKIRLSPEPSGGIRAWTRRSRQTRAVYFSREAHMFSNESVTVMSLRIACLPRTAERRTRP